MEMTEYQKYLKTLRDREIAFLWERHCSASEAPYNPTSAELSRASDIQWEMEDREAEQWRARGCYSGQGDYPDPV
jgi:hypothetical protein